MLCSSASQMAPYSKNLPIIYENLYKPSPQGGAREIFFCHQLGSGRAFKASKKLFSCFRKRLSESYIPCLKGNITVACANELKKIGGS